MALNEESTNTAYVLGRLFSVLEQIQEKAYEKDNGRGKVPDSEKNRKGINSTIKDRFFNSAAATPGWVFPILLKMANHHLRKLNDRMGLKIELEKMVTELEGKIEMNGQPIPARMNLLLPSNPETVCEEGGKIKCQNPLRIAMNLPSCLT